MLTPRMYALLWRQPTWRRKHLSHWVTLAWTVSRQGSWAQCPAVGLILHEKMTRWKWCNYLLGCRRAIAREAARACPRRRHVRRADTFRRVPGLQMSPN